MNILIFLPHVNQGWGGIRQYSVALLKILSEDTDNTYYVYHMSGDPEILSVLHQSPGLRRVSDNDISDNICVRLNDRFKLLTNRIFSFLGIAFRFKIYSVFEQLCKRNNIKVIHCPYQFIPNIKGYKLIGTLHDVQEIHFPGFFTAESRANRATLFYDITKRADKLIVSYQHVKEDLIKFFQVAEERVSVILLDMGRLWFEQFKQSDIIAISSLAGDKPFILYPANTWQHKNHIHLVEAIALLHQRGHAVQLICTGHMNEYYKEIEAVILSSNIGHLVKFAGVVDDITLYSLYHQCVGVVVPTLYEAGSFPLMEAILMHRPVICSNVTSLPETIDMPECVFDPNDINDIADHIYRLVSDDDFRKRIIEHTYIQSETIRHTGALNKLKLVYDQLCD